MFSSYAKVIDSRDEVQASLNKKLHDLSVSPKNAFKTVLDSLKKWYDSAVSQDEKYFCQEWYIRIALLAIKHGKEEVILQ